MSDWYFDDDPDKDEIPPVSSNNLGDNSMLKSSDLDDTSLVINVWNGSRDSLVEVQFDGGTPVQAVRTQQGEGEGALETLDPFALRRQLSVLRFAMKSTEADENQIWNGALGDRSDGFELWNASVFQAGSQNLLQDWMWTDQSNHIWTVEMPDLAEGVHQVTVHTTDVHGHSYRETMLFEVRTPNDSDDPKDNDPTDEKYDRQVPAEVEL